MVKDPTKRTVPEFSSLDQTRVDQVRVLPASAQDAQFEVVLVHVTDPGDENPWRTFEMATANTTYSLDSSLECVQVDPRTPGAAVPKHMLGARLVGSQSLLDDQFSISFPYPVPGMQAVFRLRNTERFLTTSVVEAVTMRVRITNVDLAEGEELDWNQITRQWRVS